MDTRLVLTLHLDAFNMAQGGGFTTYDASGKKQMSMVWPGFKDGEQTLEKAVQLLTMYYLTMTSRQLMMDLDTHFPVDPSVP